MSFTVNNNGSKFLLWSLLVVVLDQLTKYLIVSTIPVNSIGYRVAPFFDIIHVHNEGAAFSFLASSGGWQRYFFMLIAVAISIALFIALFSYYYPAFNVADIAVCCGAGLLIIIGFFGKENKESK